MHMWNTQIPDLSGCQAWQHRTQGFIIHTNPAKGVAVNRSALRTVPQLISDHKL